MIESDGGASGTGTGSISGAGGSNMRGSGVRQQNVGDGRRRL